MDAPTPDAAAIPQRLVRAVAAVVRDKDEVVTLAVTAMIAGGHVLFEDIPGVGKTTLARALAQATGGEFRRVQFTSDLLPADLTGTSVWLPAQERFEFRPGPLFANLVLADEINRAPPRTQSALLEAMEERQVTVEGAARPLPAPFVVLATQNPLEHHGTYPLPESQRDRFMLRLSLGYVSDAVEADLIASAHEGHAVAAEPVTTPPALAALQGQVRAVHLHPDLAAYAQRLVARTRNHPDVHLGVSTRGALAWALAARAHALVDGREYVTPGDLQELAVPALAHRIVPAGLSDAAGSQGLAGTEQAAEILRDILAELPVPL